MPQQPAPRRIGDRHAPEVAAMDALHAVVLREPGVEEGVVGAQQVQDAAILTHLTLEEQLGFLQQRVAQGAVVTGESHRIRHHGLQVAHLQPLPEEVVHPAGGPPIRQHPARLPFQHDRIAQSAADGRIQQRFVRNAPPQEERQARRQLHVAQRVDGPGRSTGRIDLGAHEKRRHAQERFQGARDAGLEAPGGAPDREDLHEGCEVDVRDGGGGMPAGPACP